MRRPSVLVALLFLLSGASGLVYETAWTRLFQDLFGHSVHTTSAVLAGFMAGLALGAMVAARFADRVAAPIRLYGLLEIALALWVWTSPLQVRLVDRIVAGMLASSWSAPGMGEVLRWVLACGLLVVPTAVMGATLPLLCRGLTDDDQQIGKVFGLLYGINTLGAVVGVVGAGFWLIRDFGVVNTIRVGCGLSLAAGLGAWLLSRLLGEGRLRIEAPATSTAQAPAETVSLRSPLVWVILLSGFAALAYEVVWIRLFVFVLGSNILSFSMVLGTLLLAFALGAAAMPWLVRSRDKHLDALGWVQLLLGLGAGATFVLFAELDRLMAWLEGAGVASDGLVGRALITAVVLALPGLAMGAVLPAATGAISDHRRVGRGVGRLYTVNTAGNIVGSLAAGYLMVPLLGASRALICLVLLNLLLGLAVFVIRDRGRPGLRWAAPLVAMVVVVGLWLSAPQGALEKVFSRQSSHGRLVAVNEGLRGTVTVHDVPPLPLLAANSLASNDGSVAFGYRMVAVDGVDVAGTAPDLRTTQKMQAHIPLLLHGGPQAVLQVGFGSGETTREVALHAPATFHLAEINPDVIRQSNLWFPDFAGAPYQPFFADAKNYIRTTTHRYDVILNDSTYPGLAGSSQLYSADHFRACREHLNPGGVVSTWLPVDLPEETFRLVLATFFSVFPECSFWLPANCWNKHGVLVGSLTPQEPLLASAEQGGWSQAVVRSLAEFGYGDPSLYRSMRVLDADGIRRITDGVLVSSDDRPRLEYPARGTTVSGEQFWSEVLTLILRHRPASGEGVVDLPPRLAECVRQVFTGQLALLADEPERAIRFYQRARLTWPEHPGPRRLLQDVMVFRAQAAFSVGLEALHAGEFQRAEAALSEAAKLCPVSAAAAFELGRLLFEQGRVAAAVPVLRRAVDLGEGLAPARLFLGEALLLAGRPAEAEAEYRAARAEGAAGAEVLAAQAEAIFDQGRRAEAVQVINEALRLAPANQAIERRLREMEAALSSPVEPSSAPAVRPEPRPGP